MNDSEKRRKDRRDRKIRGDGFKEGYKAGYEAGQRELRKAFRDLMELERQGEAGRSCIWG